MAERSLTDNNENPLRLTECALLLIDVINDFDFETRSQLLDHAIPAANKLSGLRTRMKSAGVPVVYVNDNFGRWHSDFKAQIQRCSDPKCAGYEVTRLLLPAEDDYFVLKPKFSGFFATSLEILLEHLKIKHLILTGFACDICVISTANDAYMRNYGITVVSDCVASETEEATRLALNYMKERLKANVLTSDAFQ